VELDLRDAELSQLNAFAVKRRRNSGQLRRAPPPPSIAAPL